MVKRPTVGRATVRPAGAADPVAALSGKRVAVVVTGVASDEEMRARIEAHRRARREWTVYEETEAVGSVVRRDLPMSALCDRAANVVAVTSEVGLSLDPLTPAGGAFSDALGTVNQGLAAAAARVYLLVAGLPVVLKEDAP